MDISKALNIDGWMSDAELRFLAVQAETANLTIEFGCYKGRSTRAMADNTKGRIIAVDPWNGTYYSDDNSIHGINTSVMEEFERNLWDKIFDGTVIPVKKFSFDFYTPLRPNFVFLDGDHRYDTMRGDIKLGLRLLENGGILAGHDYKHTDWPGVRRAVDEMFPKINLVDSIWWVYVPKSSDSSSNNGTSETGSVL